jgi:hypothetical protein
MAVLIVIGVVALSPLAGWIAYLRFCRWLIKQTNQAEDLKHAATVARAYRGAAPTAVAHVLVKLASLWHGKGL